MRFRAFFLTALAVSTSSTFAQAPPPELTLDWKSIAERIVERLDLQPGEKVIALAHPGTFREVIPHFRYAVMKSGAVDLGIVDVLKQPVPASWDRGVLSPALRSARESYRDMFRDVDASVMLPGPFPLNPLTPPFRICFGNGEAELSTSIGSRIAVPSHYPASRSPDGT